MAVLFIVIFILNLTVVKGIDWTCFLDGYHKCDDVEKCCPDGFICAGNSTCLAIGSIVGICIGALIGLAGLVVMVYLCCRTPIGSVGTVFAQPIGGTTVNTVSQQQYGQNQYGNPQNSTHGQLYPPAYNHAQTNDAQPTAYGQASFPSSATTKT